MGREEPVRMKGGKLSVWILASRPKTLWAAVGPVLMGIAMAIADQKFHLLSAAVAMIGALLIQIGTNFANDYFDYKHGADIPGRLGPTRATQAGLIPPQTMKVAFIAVFVFTFLLGLYLVWRGGWPILAVGLASILFGILYTGGPYPLGYNGLGDIFVLIFFGPVAVGGTYYVQALEINSAVLIAGIAPGLISTALLTVNNLRDVHTDRETGKRTLVVRFGVTFARVEYLASLIIACLLPLWLIYLTGGHYFSLLTVLALFPAIPSIRRVMTLSGSPELNQVLADTGKVLLIYSLLFSIGWLIPTTSP